MNRAFVVTGSGPDVRRVAVGTSIVVGRGGNCDLVIRDLAASRRHLEIRHGNGADSCRDLDSSNGTLVNGEKITTVELANGDEIRIGTTSLFFVLEPRVESAPIERRVFLRTA